MEIRDLSIQGEGSITLVLTEGEAQNLVNASLRHMGAPFGEGTTMANGFAEPVAVAFLSAYAEANATEEEEEEAAEEEQQQELPLDA